MARIRIVKLPKALSGLEVKMYPGLYGTNGNKQFSFNKYLEAGKISEKPIEARQTLEPVDREDANLEAEAGETAVINVDGMPAHFKIGGNRHSEGGTPLNLPDNSFIFSDTAKMKIKDPHILAQFGMAPKKGGYTPAEISKKYDINKFRKTLADPDTEDLDRKTAEMMIANYNLKLAKLALAQESLKGFPQGIPVIAMPYIESMEIDPSTFLPDQAQAQLEEGDQPDADMGTARFGGIPKAQVGIGFNNDPALEKKWETDADTGPYYRKYVEALKSKDPKKMQAAAQTIADADIPGFQWWPGSGQNKLTDLSQILKEEAGKIIKKNTPKEVTKEDLDIKTRQKASELFTKVYQLKQKAKEAGDPDAEIMYDDELKKLHKLHPDYKGEHFWRQETRRKAAYSVPGTGEYKPPVNPIYYSETEANEIGDLYDKYHPKAKAETKTAKTETKVVETIPSDTTINLKDLGNIKQEDLDRLLAEEKAGRKITYKQEGGELPIAQDGKSHLQAEADKRKKTTTKGTKIQVQPGVKLTPEEEEIRRKNAETTPEKYVSDEEYAELEDLYKKAQASSQGNPNKKTAETLAFQKRYHQLLPDEARRIIASEKDPTNKGKTLGHGEKYDLTANEDQMFGKRTEQYWQAVRKAPKAEEKKLPPVVKKPEVPAERKPFERNPPPAYNQKIYAPWWLQDIVKTTGAAADLMRVKKYQPWQATPEVRLPDATFYDPTRELAANTEQANLASQFHQAFTGPKSGAISQVQGKALANAADIMAKYNNMNVGIANQLNSERTSIMNQASQNKANLDTQLFDKYTVANQQFDNAKNMARQNLRQSYIDAITNRAKTQALNTLYPNYYTNPITGGFVQFKPGYDKITPNKPHEDADLEAIQKIMQKFPGTSFGEASKYVKGNKGTMDDAGDIDAGYLRSQGYSGQ